MSVRKFAGRCGGELLPSQTGSSGATLPAAVDDGIGGGGGGGAGWYGGGGGGLSLAPSGGTIGLSSSDSAPSVVVMFTPA
ncbi:MAG: hypothetical protein EOP32_13875 [Rhodococcus sp. (in: high G+C Gram-positive bacteria)]|nr:MAG: hypothetical protein EOP32_13875 [Rhodococcus sp. (in: high G+C Gram-positive bacteria)]